MPQTAFGPLVEPGWPATFAKGPDISGQIMKGMALTAEIGRRRQALENQLAIASLRSIKTQNDMDLARDKYELAVQKLAQDRDLTEQRLQISRDNAANLYDYRNAREERLADVFNQKLKEKDDAANAEAALQLLPSELERDGYTKGTNEYMNQWRARSAPYISKLPTSSRNMWDRLIHKDYVDSRDYQLRQLESDEKAFAKEYGRYVTGDDLNIDTRPMFDPKSLPDETKHPHGWDFWSNEPTGRKIVKGITPDGKVVDRPITMSELNRFKKDYQALLRRRRKLGDRLERPDLGVYAPVSTDNEIIEKDGHHYEVNHATRQTIRQID